MNFSNPKILKTFSIGIFFSLVFIILTSASVNAAASVKNATGYVNSSIGVNVRAKATTSSAVITGLSDNTKLNITEEKFTSSYSSKRTARWYKVIAGGRTGYIRADLVDGIRYNAVSAKTTDALNYRTGPGTSFTLNGTFSRGAKLSVVLKVRPKGSSELWYKIKIGGRYYYCSASWIKLTAGNKSSTSSKSGTSSSSGSSKPASKPSSGSGTASTAMSDAQFEKYMNAQGFPASYKSKLRKLHKAHPNWKFTAKKTNISFSDALSKESRDKVSLINYVYPKSWRDKSTMYIPKDGLTWFNANRSVVAYYMDPRNFLTEDRVFMFENLKYNSYQSTAAVSKILSGTALSKNGYTASMYVSAGKKYKISPVHLAARSREEVGGGSIACSGYWMLGKRYYNPFNIGATTSINPVMNGMNYARKMGWDTKQKAINGAAQMLSANYLSNNQHTLYYQRFNVANGLSKVATHQYMTNILAAYSEAYTTKTTYANYGITNEALVFEIPVYTNMPTKTALPK